jgi:hypothetical protein
MKYINSYFILFFLFIFSSLSANELNLKIKGDSTSGFYVNLYYGTIPVSTQEKVGELNLYVENEDYSIREYINHWKATSAVQNGNVIKLSGIVKLPQLETNLSINVLDFIPISDIMGTLNTIFK